MASFRKKKQIDPDGVHLLASILVCFSEITTISYEPQDESLQITFAIRTSMSQKAFEEMAGFLAESIRTYHALEGYSGTSIDLSMETHDTMSFLHVTRDIATLSRMELSMVVTVMKERFGEDLVTDPHGYASLDPEFTAMQEETLDRVLGNIRSIYIPSPLVGVREGDQVMVFNR